MKKYISLLNVATIVVTLNGCQGYRQNPVTSEEVPTCNEQVAAYARRLIEAKNEPHQVFHEDGYYYVPTPNEQQALDSLTYFMAEDIANSEDYVKTLRSWLEDNALGALLLEEDEDLECCLPLSDFGYEKEDIEEVSLMLQMLKESYK